MLGTAGREEEDITFYMSTVAKGLNPFNEEAKLKPGLYKDAHGPVKDLDPDNFDDTIMDTSADNNKVWIVEFYSDRCPICKGLVPEIKKAAEVTMKEFPGEVRQLRPHLESPGAYLLATDPSCCFARPECAALCAALHRTALRCICLKNARRCPQIAFGGVNSRVYHDIAEQHGITSYPWVTSFYKGKKIEDMAGLGGWESVYNWAKAKHKVLAHPHAILNLCHTSRSIPDPKLVYCTPPALSTPCHSLVARSLTTRCAALRTGQLEARRQPSLRLQVT